MSYLGQMVMKKVLTMQSIYTAKTKSQPERTKVAAFMGKVECKKYPKAVWNPMTKEHQMQVCKLYEQQGIKPAMKQTSTDARIATLEAQLGISSHSKERVMSRKKRERLQKNQHERKIEGILG